jgi:hypothetical protein
MRAELRPPLSCLLGLMDAMSVLDVGSGVEGPVRLFAETYSATLPEPT